MIENILQCDESLDLDFLVGRKIVKIIDSHVIELDDGSIYEIKENEGCGGCSSGWSYFSGFEELPLDNVITNVEYKDDYRTEDQYHIFVYFHDKSYDLEADDGWGNGYYGGGFTITVERKEDGEKQWT